MNRNPREHDAGYKQNESSLHLNFVGESSCLIWLLIISLVFTIASKLGSWIELSVHVHVHMWIDIQYSVWVCVYFIEWTTVPVACTKELHHKTQDKVQKQNIFSSWQACTFIPCTSNCTLSSFLLLYNEVPLKENDLHKLLVCNMEEEWECVS